jgi:hypothetical protein
MMSGFLQDNYRLHLVMSHEKFLHLNMLSKKNKHFNTQEVTSSSYAGARKT